MKAFNVFIATRDGERCLDTVFGVDSYTEDEMRRSLIDHDNYDPRIYVRIYDSREVNLDLNPKSKISRRLRGQA